MLNAPWHAKSNDLIGGWCIMTIDATPAEADEITQGEVMHEVGCFMDEKTASHIADLHNRWLVDSRVDAGRVSNIWPPSPEFAEAERIDYQKRPGLLALLASLGRSGDLRFQTTPNSAHYKKVTHIPTGKTGYGGSEVDALMNLVETWDDQTE